jgi:Skp family chaperone for outer membrane proteins
MAIAAALALTLGAAPLFAQAPASQTPRPATGGQTAPAQAPAQTPAAPAQQPALPPPAPFPTGAKVGFVNLQAIAQLTADGKAATAKVNALAQKKQQEGTDKAKKLQENQAKLQNTGNVMSDQARSQLEKEIERQQVEGQRFEQDAQAELNELQQQLQQEFQTKLMPILADMSKEKGLQVLFSGGDSGVIWIDPGIDLTLEAVKRMDASSGKPATAPAAAPK